MTFDPLTQLDLPLQGKKLTIPDREDTCSRDSLSRMQNVELVIASLPSLSEQLREFTKELTEVVDETLHAIDELKQKEMKVSSEAKTVCRELKIVTNNSYDYMRAINDFTCHAKQGNRQQLAFEEAVKKKNLDLRPINRYLQHIKQYLREAGEKYEIFRESCKGVVERLGEVSEQTHKGADEAGSKKTASQVTGGLVAGGAMAAGVGTGATVAATGIRAAGIPTLGIGTIIGLVITGVAAPVVGLGTGTAAAVGTHYVAKHYSEKKIAFQNLTACITILELKASQLNYILDQIKVSMDNFDDDLIQDVEYYTTAPHQLDSLLDSMRLLFVRIEEFHSVSSKCCETLRKKSEDLEKADDTKD